MALAETYKAYTGTMWDRLSALATWQPDVQLSVGDIVSGGAGGVVTRETTLAKLGITAERLPHSRQAAAPVREHSGVSITASGTAVVSSAGKARASFSKQSSFLVVTAQGWLDAADNMADVRTIVEELHARDAWDAGWHLVTSVRRYPACTIVIAKTAGAEAELAVDVGGAAGLAPLEHISAGAELSVNSDHASHWVMGFDSTPLYEAIGMKRHGLRRRLAATQVEYLTRDQDPDENEDEQYDEETVWTAQRSSPADLGLL